MSLDSMAIATDGYVSRTVKKALIIAVAGYLNYTDVPPTPPSGGGGGGGYTTTETHKPNEQEERRKRILIEDSILVQIVEITLKTTII